MSRHYRHGPARGKHHNSHRHETDDSDHSASRDLMSGFNSGSTASSGSPDTAKGSRVHFSGSPTIHKYAPGSPPHIDSDSNRSKSTSPKRRSRRDFERPSSIPGSIARVANAFAAEKWRAAFDIYTSAFKDLEERYSAIQTRYGDQGEAKILDVYAETILTAFMYINELKTAHDEYTTGRPARETISALRRSAGFSKDRARSVYSTSRGFGEYMEKVIEAAESSWLTKKVVFEATYEQELVLD